MLAAKLAEFVEFKAFLDFLLILFREMSDSFAFRAFKLDHVVL